MKKIAAIVITALFCVAIIVASCHLAPRDTVYATDPVPCNSCGVTLQHRRTGWDFRLAG